MIMSRQTNFFAQDEWYHCYSRGIDKRIVFNNKSDYERFIELLYLVNSTTIIHRSDLKDKNHQELLVTPRGGQLVDIGAYSLRPNHFHLLLYQKTENGISEFMQKLGTAYTMYFNIKYERSGGLFTRPFRAKHISDDTYLQHVVDYIHLNHLDLKKDTVMSRRHLDIGEDDFNKLMMYQFSSLPDFNGIIRSEKNILGEEIFDVYVKKTIKEMLQNAIDYYAENEEDFY